MYKDTTVEHITKEEDKLKETLAILFGVTVDEIDDESSSETIANWDSIVHIALLVELERVFNVKFSENEGSEMQNVKVIKQALENHGIKF